MALIEREIPLQELHEAWQQVAAGKGCFMLISGEGGIGKTTLVEHFINQQEPEVRVLWGACDELFTPRPLGPLHDISSQIGGAFATLLQSGTNQSTLFPACLREFQTVPTIVVIEDIHWADEATLDLLKFLGRRIQRSAILLLATYRDEELSQQHSLRLLLGDLATSTATRRILLKPLSVKAVRQLASQRPFDGDTLHQQTGGNPFYVTEVLAAGQGGIPPTIRDAVLARAARLSLSGRAVLNAAAVIGSRIQPWLLAEVTRAEADKLDESLLHGILREQGDALVFRHELARQTILDTIPPHQRSKLHQTVLQAIKSAPNNVYDITWLAHHAEAAGDPEAILAYAPAAAQQASKASAHREAATLYGLALRYEDDLPLEERAKLLEKYAQECDLVGQQAEGIAARRQAAVLWQTLGNPLKQGENLAYLMSMLNRIGKNTEAEEVSKASIEILETLPPGRELAMAYRVQAHQCLVSRDCDEALIWAEKALKLAERFKDDEVLAAVYITIGTAWLFLDYAYGCHYLEDKLEVVQAAGIEVRVGHIYSNLGSGSGELFHLDRAQRYLNRGIAYTTERDLDSHRLYMLAWQALVQCYQGEWQKAVDTAVAVLNSSRVNVISRITALIALGRVYTRQGNTPAAQPILDEALQLANQTNTIQRLGPARALRAEAAWLKGDLALTLQEASAVYDLAVSKQHPWLTGELAYWRQLAGVDMMSPAPWLAKPYHLQLNGNWAAAAAVWEELGCPYEQARALAEADETEAQVKALTILEQLGAHPLSEQVRQKLHAAGMQSLPRGPRPTTRENPFNLTNRQLEILTLLMAELTNAEIAAKLHISPKTVDHHVSAVLGKLNVSSREEAAEIARQHPEF